MRLRRSLTILFLIALISTEAFSEDALFPLGGDLVVTSTFGEFRLNHPHGGIDLRAAEGAPVVAPQDGYVWRIKTTCYGNGKSLYIKGSDGKIYMFMHLAGFVRKIFDRVFSEQLKTLRYSQDIFLESNEIPVKRGELVGYAGKTGTDTPHLHYELRDANNCPTNPLLSHSFSDTIAPVITKVALVPLSVNSTVDQAFSPSVKSARDKVVEFSASGKVGVAAEIQDRIPPSHRMLAPYKVTLKMGASTLFAVEMNRFCYENRAIGFLVYHNSLLKDGRFLRLYSPVAVAEPSVSLWGSFSGVLNIDGDKQFSLEACDIAGNCSTAQIKISFDSSADGSEKKCGDSSGIFLSRDFIARCAEGKIEWIGCSENGVIKGDDGDIYYGCPASGDSIKLDSWSLEVDGESLFGRQLIALKRVVRDAELGERGLNKISDAIKVLPDELLSKKGLKLCITSDAPFSKNAGIYRIGQNSGLRLEGADFSDDSKKLCARVQRAGTFAVFEDRKKPQIGDAKITKGGWPEMWFVEFPISDVGSGVEPDKISATFDGTPVVVEFMPYEGRARAYLHFVSSPGPKVGAHEILITAQDGAGNITTSVQRINFKAN